MARTTQPRPPQPAVLSERQIRLGIERIKKRIEAVQKFDPSTVTEQFNSPELKALATSIDEALTTTFGQGTVEYDRYRAATHFDRGPINMMHRTPVHKVREGLEKSKQYNIALLQQAVAFLEERFQELEPEEPAGPDKASLTPPSSRVFIVHGHDKEAKEAVARLLSVLGLEPIILHEQANMGRAVIEKFEAEGNVGFAVVLLTPDDLGKAKIDADLNPRARQNVIFEFGYFIGSLGRRHVCVFRRGEIERPSDLAGVVYEQFDDGGAWKLTLARHLRAAGYSVDMNKIVH